MHDEHGATGSVQPIEPVQEQGMQLGLADADRRVRPDHVEPLRSLDLVGGDDLDVLDAVALGVPGAQRTGPLVDVDRRHVRRGGAAGEREGDRPATAAEVEQRPGSGRRRRLAQQQLGAGIEAAMAEHAAIGAQPQRWIDEVDDDVARVGGTRRPLVEVVLTRRRHDVGSLTDVSAAIRTFGDPVLKTRAAPVVAIDGRAIRLVDEMFDSLYDCENGLALAAPQIGVQKQVVVWDLGDAPQAIFNPEIVDADGEWVYEEGCLSIPGLYVELARPKTVLVKGIDLDGNPVEREADELEARMFQHELDHLNGVLMFDRMTPEQRRQAMAEYRRLSDQGGELTTEAPRRRLRLR